MNGHLTLFRVGVLCVFFRCIVLCGNTALCCNIVRCYFLMLAWVVCVNVFVLHLCAHGASGCTNRRKRELTIMNSALSFVGQLYVCR